MTTNRQGTIASIFIVLAVSLTLSACSEDDVQVQSSGYSATIRRTAYGVPHITASDYGSLGFGQGYALAQDHACTLMDQIVKVRSERARFFGRGPNDRYLNSDFAYRVFDVHGRAERGFSSQPDDVKALLEGYAAGFNAYLADTPTGDLPGWCAGQPWVEPITAIDLLAYWNATALFASGANLIDFIATAQPPSTAKGVAAGDVPLPSGRPNGGSNGWAIGSERSESGRGMLLANPHFPWEGELRFWESHLTIPGELNVYGASLIGLAGVQIGFNEHVAWTHTVASGTRFTVYRLDLVPGDPTSYLYDGKARAMTAHDFTVQVREEDGPLTDVSRRLYSSHYGPIFDYPGVGWTAAQTLTYRDANWDNDRGGAQWLAMDRAGSLAELQAAHAQVQGLAFVNTIAASSDGEAWYIEAPSTPNISPEAIAAWEAARLTDPLVGVAYDLLNVVLLDGSHSLSEWVEAPGAPAPGLLPFSAMPRLERADFVFNANDSHWLTHPEALLEGFSPLQGPERTARSPRTRRNALTLSDRSSDGPAGSDGRFSLAELETAILANRGLIAELLRDEVVDRCFGTDLAGACQAIALWDGRDDIDSRGAPLWREFITSFSFDDLLGVPGGALFAQPFDPTDPLGTPSGLAPAPAQGPDPILQHLAMAEHHLEAGGFSVHATLGEVQSDARDPNHTPVHGGPAQEGLENVVEVGTGASTSSLEPAPPFGPPIDGSYSLTADGYPIAFGSSFLLAVEYTDEGPRAASIMTYSESGDPSSPHYADQDALFARKEWKPVAFTEAEIAADPSLQTIAVSQSRVADNR